MYIEFLFVTLHNKRSLGMKRFTLFCLILLLFCGIGYTLNPGQVGFTASVPYGNGSIKMNFVIDGNSEWGCGTGSQDYNKPCVDEDTEGELVIPDSITGPDGRAFPIQWISRGSFQSCPKLTHIHIPQTVKYISDLSFSGCTSLQEITFPERLKTIYPQAFLGCTGMRRVRFLSHHPPGCYYNDTFEETTYATATLVIPAEAAEHYINYPLTHHFRYHAETLPLYKENEE